MINTEKITTVCFTGHRKIDKPAAFYIPTKLKKAVEELIAKGASHFKCGGALGFDTVAALCILELKDKYPNIMLDLVLPCKDQSNIWGEQDKRVYRHILANASSIEYVTDRYNSHCMYERNRRLVNGSQVCICYVGKSSGGSAYTMGYAIKEGLEIINLFDI